MSLKDIRIPADAADKQTTDARSALPPVEFQISAQDDGTLITIQDRQGPQDRVPTVSYRVYFLPEAFAPKTTDPVVFRSVVRQSGRKVASLVADIKAPALGTVLNVTDMTNRGSGYYYCTAVNRSGVEAPSEHIVFADENRSLIGAAAGTGGGGAPPPPPVSWIWLETTYGPGLITGTIDGVNTGFTMTQPFGTYDVVFVDGIIDNAATAVVNALTVSTPPIGAVAVEHLA